MQNEVPEGGNEGFHVQSQRGMQQKETIIRFSFEKDHSDYSGVGKVAVARPVNAMEIAQERDNESPN